jgi:hypothetical protein
MLFHIAMNLTNIDEKHVLKFPNYSKNFEYKDGSITNHLIEKSLRHNFIYLRQKID